MAKVFDRMLFLTATPFQLGHHELLRVLERFGDVRWCARELGDRARFVQQLKDLGSCLNESQRTAICLQRSWCRLRPEDCSRLDGGDGVDAAWWARIESSAPEQLNHHPRAVLEAFRAAKQHREAAEEP